MSVHPLEKSAAPRGPLAGVGVIVTRPARQSAGLARQLAALSATPIVFPAIVILPPSNRVALDAAHEHLADFDIAIFVSANAVEYGVPAPQTWPATLATCILDARIPATTFDSEGLLALPPLQAVDGKHVVIFRGEGGRDHLGDALRQRGAAVTYVDCYRRAAPATGAGGLRDVLRDGRAHALTLTSSEGLDNLCTLLDAADLARLRRLPAFVPHPRIAVHARKLDFTPIETGGSDAGLITGLLEWFAVHPLT